MIKNIVLTSILATALGACSTGTPGMSVGVGLGTGIGRHLGIGTSLNIPIRLDQSTGKTTDNGGVNIIEEKIITHFDAQGIPSNAAVKGGFYRQLISKRGNDYLVQDFYSDNGRKRTDPYTLTRDQLMQFKATPANGSLVSYAYNGNVMQQQVFQNGKLIRAKY